MLRFAEDGGEGEGGGRGTGVTNSFSSPQAAGTEAIATYLYLPPYVFTFIISTSSQIVESILVPAAPSSPLSNTNVLHTTPPHGPLQRSSLYIRSTFHTRSLPLRATAWSTVQGQDESDDLMLCFKKGARVSAWKVVTPLGSHLASP